MSHVYALTSGTNYCPGTSMLSNGDEISIHASLRDRNNERQGTPVFAGSPRLEGKAAAVCS
eukprot:766828-Pleurochrysis_carterae.AAC.2